MRGVTGLFAYERTGSEQGLDTRLSALADNIIRLDIELDGKARRTLRIIKARGVEHRLDKHEFCIIQEGVRII